MRQEALGRLRALALGLLLTLVLAFGAELALRAYHWCRAGVPFFAFLPGYRERVFPLSPFLVFGPRVDWQIPGKQHPETAYFNSQGFRTRDGLGPKPPGELRIIALGGSTTEDVWNDEGTHWPLVVEQQLHAAGRQDVRIYNGAMSAYTTAHSLVRLALDLPQYEPDLVLVMHNVNDLLVVYSAASQDLPVDASYRVKYGRRIFTHVVDESDVVVSRLLALIRDRLERLRPREPRPVLERYDLEAGLRLFERNLRSLVTLARANGAEVVLVTMPVHRSERVFDDIENLARRGLLDSYPPHDRFLADFDRYNQAIREVGAELGAPVIDAARLVPSDDRLFADTVHTTTEGVHVMGEAVAPKLLEVLPAPK